MHIIQVTAVYKGVKTHPEHGFPFLHFEVPPTEKTDRVPLCVLPFEPAKNTTNVQQKIFEEGAKLLIEGRLYPDISGQGPMYIQPTKELQVVNQDLVMNQVFLAGNCNYTQSYEYSFKFGLNSQLALTEKRLGYTSYQDLNHKPSFWLTARYDNKKILEKLFYKGRQIAVGGKLTFSEYKDKKTGEKKSSYSIFVSSKQHSAFGFGFALNKEQWAQVTKLVNSFRPTGQDTYKPKEREAFDSPHQQAIAKPSIPETDDIPF